MKQTDTNSIRYPAAVDEKLGKLAEIFKRSKKELFSQMVDYFYRSKKDPEDWGAADKIMVVPETAAFNATVLSAYCRERGF
jgi:molybdopterin converting factor small subunit